MDLNQIYRNLFSKYKALYRRSGEEVEKEALEFISLLHKILDTILSYDGELVEPALVRMHEANLHSLFNWDGGYPSIFKKYLSELEEFIFRAMIITMNCTEQPISELASIHRVYHLDVRSSEFELILNSFCQNRSGEWEVRDRSVESYLRRLEDLWSSPLDSMLYDRDIFSVEARRWLSQEDFSSFLTQIPQISISEIFEKIVSVFAENQDWDSPTLSEFLLDLYREAWASVEDSEKIVGRHLFVIDGVRILYPHEAILKYASKVLKGSELEWFQKKASKITLQDIDQYLDDLARYGDYSDCATILEEI